MSGRSCPQDRVHGFRPIRRSSSPLERIETLPQPRLSTRMDRGWNRDSQARAVLRSKPDGDVQCRSWIVNLETPISTVSSEAHGIRDQDVVDKPHFDKVAGQIEQLLDGAVPDMDERAP